MTQRPMHAIPGAFQTLQQLYAEGEAAMDEERFEAAVTKFTEGLAIDDHFRLRYVTMYAQRAFAYQRLGQIDLAIADYTKAIEMEPEINQAQYYFHRGICHAETPGQHGQAVADFGQSIALFDEHPGPFHLRGKILIETLGDYAKGVEDMDRMLALQPHPGGHALRGYARYMLGAQDEALADFAAAIEGNAAFRSVFAQDSRYSSMRQDGRFIALLG